MTDFMSRHIFFCKGRMLAVLLVLVLAACSHSPTPATNDRLYQDLGADEGIAALVHGFLVELAADQRVVERFRGVDIRRFQQGFETYLCMISGGPCSYDGDNMIAVHAGHQYTDVEFNAVVSNLITAMEKQALPVPVQNRLLALLAPSYDDVVYQ